MDPIALENIQRLVGWANNYATVLRPRFLRPLQRHLESQPVIRQDMEALGGFNSIINDVALTPEAAQSLERLFTIQEGIQISDRFGNEAGLVPTIQENTQDLGNIIDITTKLGQHLDLCCEDLKLKLNEIHDFLKIFKSDIKNLIIKTGTDLKTFISKEIFDVKTDLINFINLKFDDLVDLYNNERVKLINYLPDLKQEIKNLIREIISDELSAIKTQLNTIERDISNINGQIAHVERLIVASTEALTTEVVAVGAAVGKASLANLGATAAVETSVGGVAGEIKAKYILDERSFKARTRLIARNISHNVDEKFRGLDGFLKDSNEGLPYIIQTEVCSYIVGESYSKWGSISMYFPTVTFVFGEITNNNKPRRSQIKIRFNKTSQEITNSDVLAIAAKVKSFGKLGYNYGKTRGNYVSKDKRFKTTVYAEDQSNICFVLEKIMDIIPDKFDKELLSVTTIGNKRPSISKRQNDLYNTGINTINYNDVFPLELKSVNIMVNGISKIIKLY